MYILYNTIIHSFISGMHLYECVAPNMDIILQSGRFWAMSIALFRERFNDSRSCWIVFIHVVRGCPGGLLQFSKREAVKICLASDSSGLCAMWLNRERRRAWTVAKRCGCSVFRLTSSFHTWWYHLIPNSLRRHHWSTASILSTSLLYNTIDFVNSYNAFKLLVGWHKRHPKVKNLKYRRSHITEEMNNCTEQLLA